EADGDSNTPSVSADGLVVAFESAADDLVDPDLNDIDDVFVHDRASGKTELVSVASDGSQQFGISLFSSTLSPVISSDGHVVAFTSGAITLVSDDNNDADDVFIHDRVTGNTDRVNVASDGAEAQGGVINFSGSPALSADGQLVAFDSTATNLVPG